MTSPHRVGPDDRFSIARHPTHEGNGDPGELEALRGRITELSDRFAADASHALLVVLQGFDGAGKDELITHVLSGVDPANLHVFSFNTPVGEEAEHDFLWRFHHQAPARGMVHVFDRSYYEEVISARVHGVVDEREAAARCDSINDFERILDRERTVVLKVFLHVSKDVQAERVRERLRRRDKQHEFSAADIEDRDKWDAFDRAYEDAINATATDAAPWYAVAADDRPAARVAVARLLVELLEGLDPQYPPPDPDELEEAGLDEDDLG
ncbi:MAG TPA: PPK2 family polyphosphate kinase [Baekduia sp.]|nr:PPK2 family polyphosphate kinase [Baekduia sp.]